MTRFLRFLVTALAATALVAGVLGLGWVPNASAQGEAPDSLQDGFLADLEGEWRMDGHVMGDSVVYRAMGTWVLGHQFLRLQMVHVADQPAYRAHVYIGYDHKNDTYVAHWLDDSGGRASRSIGTGERNGGVLRFAFDYPEGPFQTVFERRSPMEWHSRMRSKDEGEWTPFARYDMTPRTAP